MEKAAHSLLLNVSYATVICYKIEHQEYETI